MTLAGFPACLKDSIEDINKIEDFHRNNSFRWTPLSMSGFTGVWG